MLWMSAVSLLLSVYLVLRSVKNRFYGLLVTLLSTLSLFLIFAYLIADSLTHNGFDESVLFHLKVGLTGANLYDFWKIIGLGIILVPFLILFCVFVYKMIRPRSLKKEISIITLFSSGLLLVLSYISNPILDDFSQFFASSFDRDFYKYYRVPKRNEVVDSKKKKNIVYIYAESLERTYFDEDIFPGLITELKKIEDKSISFENIFQVYATGWTIAGMTASQCGMPLITPSGGNSMSGVNNKFLPGAVCLGDLLKDNGYMLEYFGGSSLLFAGKGNFYTSHSFDKVYGKRELESYLSDRSYMTGWGLYDDSLLNIAYKEFEALSKKDEPFGLFMLTLDTHHPQGNSSNTCKELDKAYKKGDNSMLNAVKCSDFLLSSFINKILDSEFAEDTLIVLTSDHLAMPNDAYTQLEQGKRRNLFMIIDGAQMVEAKKIPQKGSMLDVSATVISFLGLPSMLGLGRDLLQDESLIEINNAEDKVLEEAKEVLNPISNQKSMKLNVLSINGMLASWRRNFLSFWDFPTLLDGLSLDENTKTVSVGAHQLNFPLVLDVKQDGSFIPKFGFDEKGNIEDHIMKIEKNHLMIWIDDCRYMDDIVNVEERTTEFCMAMKKRNQNNFEIFEIKGNTIFSKKEIVSLLDTSGKSTVPVSLVRLDSKYKIEERRKNLKQCLFEEINPEEVIKKYASKEYLILLSGFLLDTEFISKKFLHDMDEQKSVFSSIHHSDLYLGVIQNKKLLQEQLGTHKPVYMNFNKEGFHIDMKSEGITYLYRSSILINDLELSHNSYGLNMVVLNTKTGDVYRYFFPTYVN